jgi:hypothetical protein
MASSIRKNLSSTAQNSPKVIRPYQLYAQSLLTDEDKDFLVANNGNHYFTRHWSNCHIESEHTLRILRECTVVDRNGKRMPPKIALAPIGPITIEHILAGTTAFQSTPAAMAVYDSLDREQLTKLEHGLWCHVLAAFRGTVGKPLSEYDKGMAHLLLTLVHHKWDERLVQLFINLKNFMLYADPQQAFGDFSRAHAVTNQREFSTFTGEAPESFDKLVEAWSHKDSLLRPRGTNMLRVLEVLDKINREDFVQMILQGTFINATGYVSKNNQPLMLVGAVSNRSGTTVMSTGTLEEELIPLIIKRALTTNTLTVNAVSTIVNTVKGFVKETPEGDQSATVITRYLMEHVNEFEVREILALLYGATKSSSVMAAGTMFKVRYMLTTMIKTSRSSVDSLAFIARTVLEYDGSLPTERMWDELMASDKENHELSMAPNIILAVSDTSDKKRDHNREWDLRGFRTNIDKLNNRRD